MHLGPRRAERGLREEVDDGAVEVADGLSALREKFRAASDLYRRQTRKMDKTRTISSPLVQMIVSLALATVYVMLRYA